MEPHKGLSHSTLVVSYSAWRFVQQQNAKRNANLLDKDFVIESIVINLQSVLFWGASRVWMRVMRACSKRCLWHVFDFYRLSLTQSTSEPWKLWVSKPTLRSSVPPYLSRHVSFGVIVDECHWTCIKLKTGELTCHSHKQQSLKHASSISYPNPNKVGVAYRQGVSGSRAHNGTCIVGHCTNTASDSRCLLSCSPDPRHLRNSFWKTS